MWRCMSRNAHENSVNLGATPNKAILDRKSGFTQQEGVEQQQKSLQAIEIITAGANKSEKSNF